MIIKLFLLIIIGTLVSLKDIDGLKEEESSQSLATIIKSIDNRLTGLEKKILPVDFIDQAFRMNAMDTQINQVVSAINSLGVHVTRIDSILSKLQLTDQEKRKWCDKDYRESLISTQKSESRQLQERLTSLNTEIQGLIRSGLSKLIVKTDSLISDTREMKEGVKKLFPVSSSTSTLSSASNERSTTFDFRSLAENTLDKMVKKIESTEDKLTKSILQAFSTSQKLSQLNNDTANILAEIKHQIKDLSSNAPIARILNYLQKTLQSQSSSCVAVNHDTYALLDKSASLVNQMINSYSGQIITLNTSVTNMADTINKLDNIITKYKKHLQESNENIHNLWS